MKRSRCVLRALLVGDDNTTEDTAAGLAALDAYRNLDGGYGWGLEPDLRSSESQPSAALHAFEAMADAAPATTPNAPALCDWLHSVALPDPDVGNGRPTCDGRW